MSLSPLTAISPIDGRYNSRTVELQKYFSEFGLIRYRVIVEIEYFISLCENKVGPLNDFPLEKIVGIRKIGDDFSEDDALRIKEIEKTTNHDVKAVEYFLKEEMTKLGLEKYLEFIHFGLTSQDINNTSVPLSLKEAISEVYIPQLEQLIGKLEEMKHD
jgi:adenylosuccinate lyase